MLGGAFGMQNHYLKKDLFGVWEMGSLFELGVIDGSLQRVPIGFKH